eukprot:COSAG02_NODE_4167_length_5679_cov_8.313799_1_plen_223_part_00
MKCCTVVTAAQGSCIHWSRYQLRPGKLCFDYQRALLLDKSALFRGGSRQLKSSRRITHQPTSTGRIQQRKPLLQWLRGISTKHRLEVPAEDAASRARIEDELRLVMSPRWFHGAGMRITDNLPPAGLVASIASAQVQAAAVQEQLFIWFIGDTDPSGMSWCPDCNQARSFLAPRLAELPATAVVLEVAVSRNEWRNQEHPYRHSPVSPQASSFLHHDRTYRS